MTSNKTQTNVKVYNSIIINKALNKKVKRCASLSTFVTHIVSKSDGGTSETDDPMLQESEDIRKWV